MGMIRSLKCGVYGALTKELAQPEPEINAAVILELQTLVISLRGFMGRILSGQIK